MWRTIAIVQLVLLGLCGHAAERLDFHQALERALKKSPDFDILVQTDKNTQLAYKTSWSVLLPELDAEATDGFNRQGGNSYYSQLNPVNPWSNLLNFTVTENLYDNGKSWNEVDVARLNREIGALSLRRGKMQILLTVAQAYFDYSVAAQSLSLQSQELETLKQQFHTIEGRYRNGVNSNRDYLRIKAQVERSEVDLISQQITLELSRQALRQAIGDPEGIDFIPFSPKAESVAQVKFHDIEPEITLDFQIAHRQEQISDIHYREVQREDWPRLSLKGSYGYNVPQFVGPNTAGTDSPYWNLQAGVVLDYAIWDWGIRRRNLETADNQRQIERDNQEKIRLQVRQDLRRWVAQSALYQKSYQESVRILKDQEEVYASLNRGYRDNAKVTYLELITGLQDLYASRTQFVTLEFGLLKSGANLAYYEGNLDEFLKNQ